MNILKIEDEMQGEEGWGGGVYLHALLLGGLGGVT